MKERLQKIKLLLLDVDGVMTDGRIVFDSNGVESKFFNVKDGHGIKMIQRAGIEVGIISGRQSQVAFMGDDIIDIPVLRRVGFAAAPADAVEEVLPHVHFVTKKGGGCGAVREVCDLLLKGQGIWETATARYSL